MQFIAWAVCGFSIAACTSATEPSIPTLDGLSTRFESLRKEYNVPALAVGLAQADGSTWFTGLGRTADGTRPTNETVFHLASLTKSFASALLLQLVAEGKVSLDDPTSKYGVNFTGSPDVRVIHLLTHTSEGTPGARFIYNGNRYAQLDQVILRTTGRTFADLAADRINQRFALNCTGPSSDPRLAAKLTPGVAPDGVTPTKYQTTVSSAAGFVSCIDDMLRYAAAWDGDMLLSRRSVDVAWTPTLANDGKSLPYGLGWFVTTIGGQQIVWHYGLWTGTSALIIKLPARGLTLVMLANSEMLSREFNLGSGDLLSSPFARAFLSFAGVY